MLLTLVQITDSYTSSYTATFPSRISAEFLVGLSQNEQGSIMALVTGIATVGMYIVLLNQYLLDKFGRKAMLVVTTLGMGISALLLALSVNIVMYTIFLFTTYIFFSSDIWMIYIAEESSSEKRGFFLNLFLAIGVVGPMVSSLFRSIFLTDSAPVGAWRGMAIFPIITGLTAGIMGLVGAKETQIFNRMKIEHTSRGVKMTPQMSFMKNVKAMMATPQRRAIIMILIISFLTGLNFILLQLGESFIRNNVALAESQVTLAIALIAMVLILVYLIIGKLADRVGRLPLIYVFTIMLPLATIFLNLAVTAGPNAFLLATLGMVFGYVGYYVLWSILRIILMEIVATERRGTASGVRAIIQAFGTTVGLFIGSSITLEWGLGIAFVVLSIPVLATIFLTRKYLMETKGINLESLQ